MCNPLAIVGVALTAASTVANTVAANQVQKARNDALAAERIRQQGYQREADAANLHARTEYQDFGGQQDERGKQLGDYFQQQTIDENTANQQAAEAQANAVLPDASGIVVAEDKKQADNARDFTNAQATALGNLRSFGDLMGEKGRVQARDAMTVGQIGGFMKGSSSVLPYELEAANNAGRGANFLGDLLGMGSQFALGKGLQGSYAPTATTLPSSGASLAAGRAIDRATMPGYSAYSLYPRR